jgi:hypothetical protein
MTSTLRELPKLCMATSLALVLAAAPVAADIPDNLTDIPSQSHEWGSEQLRSRGYSLTSSDRSHGKTWEYWWNHGARTCIKARADHHRYEALMVTARTDCNQYHKDDNDNNKAAAVAIGAAALIGAAILAHKSHERDEKHGQDEKSVAEFDRGYRDGLHHSGYHNYNRTDAYADGYNAGQGKRDREIAHRSYDGDHSGYQRLVEVKDLVGANAARADSALRRRGFSDTGGYQKHGKSHVFWYNADTRQCIDAVTKDGNIRRLENLPRHTCEY